MSTQLPTQTVIDNMRETLSDWEPTTTSDKVLKARLGDVSDELERRMRRVADRSAECTCETYGYCAVCR